MENKIWNLGDKFIGRFSIFEGEVYELQKNDDPMYNSFILNTIKGTPGIYCSGDTIEKVSEEINDAITYGYIKEISSYELEKIKIDREQEISYLGKTFVSGANSVFSKERYELQYKEGKYVLETIEGIEGAYIIRENYEEVAKVIEEAIESGFLEMEG